MRLAVLAGERSGDQLGAALIDVLQPTSALGVVGPVLASRGVRALGSVDELSVVGLTDAVRELPRLIALHRRVLAGLLAERPDRVVTIDAPSFNLRLGRALRAHRIPVVHWVSPQLWAWRPGRAARVAASCDALACLFPFEPALYRSTGLDARFTGHPAAAATASSRPNALGIAGGSRPGERARLATVLREVAASWGGPVIEAVPAGLSAIVPNAVRVEGVPAMAQRVGRAVACMGTATLELAAAGVPHVAVYRMDPVTWSVARRVVRVGQVALPNLVLGVGRVPELLQDFSSADVLRALEHLTDADGDALREVSAVLRPERAVERVAELVRQGVR